MSQYSVHRNLNAATKARFPLLLDTQTDYLSDVVTTRVVIPLCPTSAYAPQTIQSLTPTVPVNGTSYVVLTPQLAAITAKELGPVVADLSAHRSDFIKALDILLTGS
jgi:toxin CcdB